MTRAHDRSRPKEDVRSRHASLAIAQHVRRDSADPRQSKLCLVRAIAIDRPEQCCGVCLPTLVRARIGMMVIDIAMSAGGEPFRPGLPQMPACARVPAALSRWNLGPYAVRKNYLARRWWRFTALRGRCSKTPQYVVDRFLRPLEPVGHERVVRRRPGIANDINKQCTAACLTSHGSGHISAPPRWGAGSRRKSRRSLTTRTATSQAILAAEFFSRGRCALAAMPVHSLCADARQGWTRDGDKETGSRCRPLTS
jgi:hypothetical protein